MDINNTPKGSPTVRSKNINNNILGASQTSEPFFKAHDNDCFKVVSNNIEGTFYYKSLGWPNIYAGQFNNLDTLAEALDKMAGLKAEIVNNRILITNLNSEFPPIFTDIKGDLIGGLELICIGQQSTEFHY
jgi:hypothetical protein